MLVPSLLLSFQEKSDNKPSVTDHLDGAMKQLRDIARLYNTQFKEKKQPNDHTCRLLSSPPAQQPAFVSSCCWYRNILLSVSNLLVIFFDGILFESLFAATSGIWGLFKEKRA